MTTPNPACDFGPRRARETRSRDTPPGHVMTRDDRDVWPDTVPVGTFAIDPSTIAGYPGVTAHLMFVCPNGRRCGVLVGPVAVPRPTPDTLSVWGWNGDTDQPTLTPSINCLAEKNGAPAGGCGWHGFITNGAIT